MKCSSFLLSISILLVGSSTYAQDKAQLTLVGGDPVHYLCQQNQTLTVRYYSLSDKSLDFVKLTLPNRQEYTLPQAMSASGVRYTDEREFVWWNTGKGGFVEKRDANGQWQRLYDHCQPKSVSR